MRKGHLALSVAIASLVVVAAPAAAQSPAGSEGPSPAGSAGAPPQPSLPDGWSLVASGLNSPRGVAVTADGTVYVAEAGTGGTDPCIEHPELGHLCFGTTGSVSKISGGTAQHVVEGVMSGIAETGETFGPSAVAVGSDGTVWYTVGGPAAGAADTRAKITGGEGIGKLYKLSADGTSTAVADLAAFESASNPDAQQPGNELPDSNVNSVVLTADGGAVVTDAGANDLLAVDNTGKISPLAVFPVVFQAAPADPTVSPDPNATPAMIPMDPVPTSVAIGSDGAYYVGTLTGFPFPKGGATVFKVVAGSDPTPYGTGFTNVMGVAFAPDGSLYVLEIAHDGLLAAAPGTLPEGGLWRIPAGGGTPELLVSQGLPMPGGIAVGGDGTVYVSTCAVCPGGGSVVSYKPAS
jgi:hypothetical protein